MIILSRKKQNEILKRLCANEIIFRHAMNALPVCEEWFDSTDKYINNSCEIAVIVDGVGGAIKVKNTLEKRYDIDEVTKQLKEQNK